ncbi:MAG: 30S ribosomal protein S8 [Thermodesulfobacteriota bacterium]
MSMTDPIADLLTRIRNAMIARHDRVDVPCSKMKTALVRILKDEGYIKNYKIIKDNKQGLLRVFLKYTDENKPVIQGLKRISRPSARVYVGAREIPLVMSGMGVGVVSTSQGMLTDREARRRAVGGEMICSVW